MACCWCIHFIEPDGQFSIWPDAKKTGKCALQPQWIDVPPDHFCSQLRLRDAGYPLLFYRQRNAWHEELQKERQERLRLAKINKELRKKMKATASSPSEAERE